ncbi:GMC oxidoreductase [Neolentinus lepideus HHB14362 ss-1]|uniref:GMC oxidoreductase n=1 Tax=Neolentinus lepideus HHB14362 ss-1 TaxID=1314782 RepID=A0A165UGT8_9AGAM|nr:GMC oxidoreductase [Neolentinus lepideus HHB14362 ss-1]
MPAKLEEVADRSFDFVIVGGGTAGLCLAARLTEDPDVSVCVLEAGAANLNDPNLLRPASFGTHFGQPHYDWCFRTKAQKHCNGTQFLWQRGKGLGGSSGINFLCWSKPPKEDIDDIERLGNPGWNWENYQKYSHRTEKFVYPTPEFEKSNKMDLNHWRSGNEGPLLTAFPAKIPKAELEVQQTLLNLGLSVAHDPLGGDPHGVFFTPSTVDPKTHTRTYATTAFYLPNTHRPNLTVLVHAQGNRIIMDSEKPEHLARATGVEFECEERICVVNAKREVILCAGALKSPQLLELSGIGQTEVLEKIGVNPVVEISGVGENVQEHVFAGIVYELKDDAAFETLDILRDPKIAAQHIELHAVGQGVYTTGIVGFAFAPLSAYSRSAAENLYSAMKDKVDRETARYGKPGLKEMIDIQLERLERGAPSCEIISFPGFLGFPAPPKPGKKYISILVAMNHNFSRGTIHSTTRDPREDPEFDPHYFEEDIDFQTFLETVKFVRTKLGKTAPFCDMIAGELNPGPEVETDEDIADWLKSFMMTTYHTVGSCSMLPKDKGGVVDPDLKVYGTHNIRVVDLSIVPLHIAAHTQATAYAIAEKAADILKAAYS